jgi:hypothetical protein
MRLAYHEYAPGGRAVNGMIGRQLETVCDVLLKSVPAVQSIILTGGFARGEGPVKVKGGRIYPYNDYDITAVSGRPPGKEEVDAIATAASESIGSRGIKIFYPFRKEGQKLKDNFYVDLKVVARDELLSSAPRIRNYELRNHGLVLYGSDLRNLVPDFSLSEIPLSEGMKLLMDRMSQLVEYFSVNGRYDPEFLTYIIQQAYAACCTSLLLLSGKYRIGYVQAMKVLEETYEKDFPQLHEKVPGLAASVKKYTQWKLNPGKLPDVDVEAAWFRARDDIFEVSKFFFSKVTRKDVRTVGDLSAAISRSGRMLHEPFLRARFGALWPLAHPLAVLYLKRKYKERVKTQNRGFRGVGLMARSPDELIFSALPYVAMSLERKGRSFPVNEDYRKKALAILREVYPQEGGDSGWDGLTLYYAGAYIAFFMQKL